MRAIIFILVLLVTTQIVAQSPNQKIGNSLSAAMVKSGPHDVMVIMADQAEIATAHLATKLAKAEYTYLKLAEVTERSQREVQQYLDSRDMDYHTYNVINAISLTADNEMIEALAAKPEVHKVIYDPWFKLDLPEAQQTTSYRMSDTTYGIKLLEAHKVWEQGYTGQGVVVAGQDTGYEWDLDPIRSKYRGWNAEDSTAQHDYNWHDAIHEISPLNNDSIITPELNPCGLDALEPCDDNNHGTHTMGTMVGSTEDDFIGIAPDAKWIGCRSLERGWGKLSTYVECFEFFLAPTNLDGEQPDPSLAPHVINNSWYCPAEEGCTPETWEVMEVIMINLRASGVFIVVSAGNAGPECSTISAPPAIFESAFTVGAINETDLIAGFSSRGPLATDSITIAPHVVAPGVDVKSVVRGGGFSEFSGTSMSGPHVVGLVALLISVDPNLAGNIDKLEEIIMATTRQKMSTQDCSDALGQNVPNGVYGHGIVNARLAVEAALLQVSTTDVVKENNIRVYPNPTDGSVSIESDEPILNISIMDVSGKLQLTKNIETQDVRNSQVDISNLMTGLYIYTISTSKGIFTGKISKL